MLIATFVSSFFHDTIPWDQKMVMDEMFGAEYDPEVEEPSWYSAWFGGHVGRTYAFAIFMHVFLGGLSLFKFFYDEEKAKSFQRTYKSWQLVAVLLEVLNFCKLLQLYGYSQ